MHMEFDIDNMNGKTTDERAKFDFTGMNRGKCEGRTCDINDINCTSSDMSKHCAKCEEAEKLMRDTAAKLKIEAQIEKISDLPAMLKAGIMSTPAVSIDDVVKCTGRVPTAYEAAAWLTGKGMSAAAGGEGCGCSCGGKC